MAISSRLDLGTLHAALDADPDRVFVLDDEGRYAFFNQATRAAMPGDVLDRLIGRTPSEGLPAEIAAPIEQMVRRALDGHTLHERRELPTLTGGRRTWEMQAVPVRDGLSDEVSCVLLRSRDVTAEVSAQAQLRREAELQRSIATLSRAAAGGVATREILSRAAEAVRALLGSGAAAVVRRGRGGEIVVAALAGEGLSLEVGDRTPVGEWPAVGAAIESRVPVTRRLAKAVRVRPELGVSTAAPIRSRGRTWGAVVAWAERADASEHGLPAALAQLADVIGLALDAASSRRRLGSLALTDPLTGLANARAVRDRLEAEIAEIRRYGGRLVLAQIDLDRFKLINDVHGHAAGDAVLRAVGAALRENARAGDLVGRMGGEEFVWLMLHAETADAIIAAERLRRAIARTAPPGGAPVTASVGIAALGPDDDVRSLLAGADLAVYQAKADGRDLTRVCAVVGGEIDAASRAVLVEHDRIVEGLRALARRRAGDPMLPSRWASAAAERAAAAGWQERDVRRLRDAAALIGVEPEFAAAVLSGEQVSWLRGEGEGGRLLGEARIAA